MGLRKTGVEEELLIQYKSSPSHDGNTIPYTPSPTWEKQSSYPSHIWQYLRSMYTSHPICTYTQTKRCDRCVKSKQKCTATYPCLACAKKWDKNDMIRWKSNIDSETEQSFSDGMNEKTRHETVGTKENVTQASVSTTPTPPIRSLRPVPSPSFPSAATATPSSMPSSVRTISDMDRLTNRRFSEPTVEKDGRKDKTERTVSSSPSPSTVSESSPSPDPIPTLSTSISALQVNQPSMTPEAASNLDFVRHHLSTPVLHGVSDVHDNTSHGKKWSEEEIRKFETSLQLYGRDWERVSRAIGTRDPSQVKAKAKRYFKQLYARGIPLPEAVIKTARYRKDRMGAVEMGDGKHTKQPHTSSNNVSSIRIPMHGDSSDSDDETEDELTYRAKQQHRVASGPTRMCMSAPSSPVASHKIVASSRTPPVRTVSHCHTPTRMTPFTLPPSAAVQQSISNSMRAARMPNGGTGATVATVMAALNQRTESPTYTAMKSSPLPSRMVESTNPFHSPFSVFIEFYGTRRKCQFPALRTLPVVKAPYPWNLTPILLQMEEKFLCDVKYMEVVEQMRAQSELYFKRSPPPPSHPLAASLTIHPSCVHLRIVDRQYNEEMDVDDMEQLYDGCKIHASFHMMKKQVEAHGNTMNTKMELKEAPIRTVSPSLSNSSPSPDRTPSPPAKSCRSPISPPHQQVLPVPPEGITTKKPYETEQWHQECIISNGKRNAHETVKRTADDMEVDSPPSKRLKLVTYDDDDSDEEMQSTCSSSRDSLLSQEKPFASSLSCSTLSPLTVTRLLPTSHALSPSDTCSTDSTSDQTTPSPISSGTDSIEHAEEGATRGMKLKEVPCITL